MGIEYLSLKEIVKLKPVDVLSLGYPDALIDHSGLVDLGVEMEGIPLSPFQQEARQRHGFPGQIYDTDAIFKKLGMNVVYVDIVAGRGVEQIVNLNEDLPLPLQGQFDLVFDGGTLEHCFNVGQAFKNILLALKEGGSVVHTNPISCGNHGFWNMSPTAYNDFYEQNGFKITLLQAFGGNPLQRVVGDIPRTNRCKFPTEIWSLVVATQQEKVPARWPTQTKYM